MAVILGSGPLAASNHKVHESRLGKVSSEHLR